MPRKPKRPCSFPGCPSLTDRRYCEKHQKIMAKRYEKYERSPATKKRYGRTWKKIRDAYVASHPLCELCLKKVGTWWQRKYTIRNLWRKAGPMPGTI